ncbi:MAG: HlyD family efflux transporter periplasmic adaptor subunit, partial [Myxococcota bacterium]
MSRQRRIQIIAAVVVVAAILAALLLRHYDRYPTTDDAYVEADVVGIVAQVAGPIVDLPIVDNQPVPAGDLLFAIDPRPFQIAVDQARAELDRTGQDVTALADAVSSAEAGVRYSQAQLRLAETQWRRVEPLAKVGAVPFQDRDKAQANLDSARAGLENANAVLARSQAELGEADADNPDIRAAVAKLEQAELELSYATVLSPVNGFVTDLDLSPGSYASVGSPMLALVNTDSWRVEAYFKETQLEGVRPGQPAMVFLPAYPGVTFEGSVQGIGWGVEQQEGDGARGPSGVPTVTPTVDWVRMAQRFPVRITLADTDPAHPLRKGMRATVRIDTTE